jgi:hypothetical protein
MKINTYTFAFILMASGGLAGSADAALTSYTSSSAWTAAVNTISTDIRSEDFGGFANGTQIGGAERGPGMTFRQFQGTTIFPRVDNDSPFGGGWLVNRNNPGFDEFENGFVIDFTEPTFAVSMNDNPNEAVRLRVYDASDNLLGEMSNSKGTNFLGIVSDAQQITYATVVNLPPEDGIFAIDNLQIGVGVVPDPSAYALITGIISLALVIRRRI